MTDKKMKKGFTLIEIVIVLAIAALIMVVVFFAVTGAQRGQRNDARQQLASRTLAAMATVRGNNNGSLSFGAAGNDSIVANQASYLNGLNVGSTSYTIIAAASKPAGGSTCDPSNTAVGQVGSTIAVGTDAGKDYSAVCLEGATATGGTWYVASN